MSLRLSSTLVKLLLRFYDPAEGEILVNGVNIKDYNLKAYRSLFAAAFQDGKLFARSIRDNLLMGRDVPENWFLHENLAKAVSL